MSLSKLLVCYVKRPMSSGLRLVLLWILLISKYGQCNSNHSNRILIALMGKSETWYVIVTDKNVCHPNKKPSTSTSSLPSSSARASTPYNTLRKPYMALETTFKPTTIFILHSSASCAIHGPPFLECDDLGCQTIPSLIIQS